MVWKRCQKVKGMQEKSYACGSTIRHDSNVFTTKMTDTKTDDFRKARVTNTPTPIL